MAKKIKAIASREKKEKCTDIIRAYGDSGQAEECLRNPPKEAAAAQNTKEKRNKRTPS